MYKFCVFLQFTVQESRSAVWFQHCLISFSHCQTTTISPPLLLCKQISDVMSIQALVPQCSTVRDRITHEKNSLYTPSVFPSAGVTLPKNRQMLGAANNLSDMSATLPPVSRWGPDSADGKDWIGGLFWCENSPFYYDGKTAQMYLHAK